MGDFGFCLVDDKGGILENKPIQVNKPLVNIQKQREFDGFEVDDDVPVVEVKQKNANNIEYKFEMQFDKVAAMDLSTQVMEVEERNLKLKLNRQVMHAPKHMAERIYETNQDTAALGSKSFKSNKQYKAERNKRISDAKKKHKKATAYTLEVVETIETLKKQRAEKADKQPDDDGRNDQILTRLEKVEFTPQMFYGANIRQNFAYYMSLVYDYKELSNSIKEQDINPDEDNTQYDRYRSLTDVMDAFINRMRVYCESNMIHLDGTALGKKERPATLKLDDVKSWTALTDSYEQKRKSSYDLSKAELDLAMPEQEVYKNEDEVKIIDVTTLATPMSRIKNINKIRFTISSVEATINKMVEFYTANRVEFNSTSAPEMYAQWLNDLDRLRRQKTLYMSYYILAYREYEYLKAKTGDDLDDAENIDELAAKAKEAWQDMCIVETSLEQYNSQRTNVRRSRSVDIVSAGEAMMNDSTMKSMAAREPLYDYQSSIATLVSSQERLKKADRTLSKDAIKSLKKLSEALRKYAINDMYKAGKESERDYLIDVYSKIKKAKRYNTAGQGAELVNQVESCLRNMSDGNLEVPKGAQIIDGTRKGALKNRGPQNDGWVRNAFLTGVDYFKDMSDVPLFAHEPTVNDVQQKMVTNCYMCSAVSSVIELDPSIIKNAIKDNGDGTATVRLYKKNRDKKYEPVYVRVKKSIPKVFGADLASTGALWMQMLEKAIAVVGMEQRGGEAFGYRALWYNSGDKLIAMLTGAKGYQMGGETDLDKISDDEKRFTFERIMNWKNEKKIYTCGSHHDAKLVQPGHAYAIIGARIENGEKIIRLRNPYSHASSVYDYGKDAETLTKKGHLDFMGSPDDNYGIFDLKWDDFTKEFSSININDLSGVLGEEVEEEAHEEKIEENPEMKEYLQNMIEDDEEDF